MFLKLIFLPLNEDIFLIKMLSSNLGSQAYCNQFSNCNNCAEYPIHKTYLLKTLHVDLNYYVTNLTTCNVVLG